MDAGPLGMPHARLSGRHRWRTGVSVTVVVEFIGGPHDGLIQALPDLRSPYLFPVDRPLTLADYLEPVGPVVSTYLVYEVDLDPEMKRPSLNDHGRYRYSYRGVR